MQIHTCIKYSWRYKQETNTACFWERGLRDWELWVGRGKSFLNGRCPLYLHSTPPLFFLLQPRWPCCSFSHLWSMLLIRGLCICRPSAWNALPPDIPGFKAKSQLLDSTYRTLLFLPCISHGQVIKRKSRLLIHKVGPLIITSRN